MAKTRAEKDRSNKRNNKKRKLGVKGKKKDQKNPIRDHDPTPKHNGRPAAAASSSSDEDAAPSPEQIQRLLDPYTKEQLIGFLLDAAVKDAGLRARIHAVADSDVSHRKVFVHGLGWDTTRETLAEAFQSYGATEDCNVVVDKVTGRSKGYGFVLFSSRAGAVKALKEPQKTIKNRLTHSQLASVGPVSAGGGGPHGNAEGRRVYVSNVHTDAAPDKLKAFFTKFGEIEAGPIGFDMSTGKSRGFALFIYKTQEGAARALEEPYKMFEGHQLHCQKATDPKKARPVVPAMPPAAPLLGAAQQPMLAAVAAAQNLALYSQNPAYAALLGQNPLLAAAALNPAAAALNPAAAAALNPTAAAAALGQAVGFVAPQGQQYGGAGINSASPLVFGTYGSYNPSSLQGLQSFQGSEFGQSSSMRPGSSFGGFSSYL